MIVRFVDKESEDWWCLAVDGFVVKPFYGVVTFVASNGDVGEVEYHQLYNIIIEDEGGDEGEQAAG